MYKVSTENGEYHIGFTNEDGTKPLLNSVYSGYEVKGNIRDGFVIIRDGAEYKADVLRVDYKEKKLLVKVNGKRVEVNAADRFDMLLNKLGMTELANKKINVVKSPMPGLILDILVQPGQTVVAGETLLILEAMKMENMIKSPADSIVKTVKVVKGNAVEKNQLLIEFE